MEKRNDNTVTITMDELKEIVRCAKNYGLSGKWNEELLCTTSVTSVMWTDVGDGKFLPDDNRTVYITVAPCEPKDYHGNGTVIKGWYDHETKKWRSLTWDKKNKEFYAIPSEHYRWMHVMAWTPTVRPYKHEEHFLRRLMEEDTDITEEGDNE